MDHETSDQVLMLQSDGLSTAESSDPGIGYWVCDHHNVDIGTDAD